MEVKELIAKAKKIIENNRQKRENIYETNIMSCLVEAIESDTTKEHK